MPCAGLQAQIFPELPTINLKSVWLLEEKNTLCSMHVTFSTADYIAYQHVRLVHVASKGTHSATATLQEPWRNLDSLNSFFFSHLDV